MATRAEATSTVPHNQLAEEAVIGSLMLEREAIVKVAPWLRPQDFHFEALGKIYGVVLSLFERRIPADPVTLFHELEATGQLSEVGGAAQIMGTVNKTPTAAHVVYYARIVVEEAVRRAMVSAGTEIAYSAHDRENDVADLMARAHAMLNTLHERGGSQEFRTLETVAGDYLDRLEFLRENPGMGVGVPTGYRDLDRQTGGWQPGDLIVLAARPGQGKTSLALNCVHRLLKVRRQHDGGEYSIGLFSLEMSREQLFHRLISVDTGIPSEKLRGSVALTEHELGRVNDAIGRLGVGNVLVDDRRSVTIADLSARAVRMKQERGLDLLIVDYLQLVRGTGGKEQNRVQEVGEVARRLKDLAGDVAAPVIACCQLKRPQQGHGAGVPHLDELRESGDIEAACDVCIMLHREEEYNPNTERRGLADLHFRKHRSGPLGVVTLYFEPHATRFNAIDWREG
jgi:replicative DNA helicase